jgi:hypothetical protein
MRKSAFYCALLAPSVAVAAGGPAVLDLTSGAPKELLGKTLGIAMGLIVPCFLFGLLLELFGQSPAKPRDYAGYGFRLVVIVVLLKFYGTIFGSVVNFAEGLATRVTPQEVWSSFSRAQAQNFEKLWKRKSAADEAAAKAAAKGQNDAAMKHSMESANIGGSILGGLVFESLVAVLVLIGQAAHWVMGFLARVLGILFYVLGPLALVFSIPRASDAAGRWFRMFVTILSWPIFSGLILNIALSVGSQGMALDGVGAAFASVVAALLLIATAVVTPFLAAAMVGGTLKNIAQQGLDAATARFKSVHRVIGPRLRSGPPQLKSPSAAPVND